MKAKKNPRSLGLRGFGDAADAASGVGRYGADLTGEGVCLHAAAKAAAERQRRRRLAVRI